MLDFIAYSLELLARLLLAVPFLHSGINAIQEREATLKLIQSKNLPLAPILLTSAIVLKIGGGVCLIFGFKILLFSIALALFTALCTFLFHDFWNYQGERRMVEIFWFTTNVGLIGGLLLLASMKMPIYL